MTAEPQHDDAAPDIEELARRIADRATARVEAGEYPATLDSDLDHHYRAVVASRNPGTPLHEQLLSSYDAATGGHADHPEIRRLRDAVRTALVMLADELPVGRGSMPERLDDLLGRVIAMERALGAGPESIALLLDRVRTLENDVAALRSQP